MDNPTRFRRNKLTLTIICCLVLVWHAGGLVQANSTFAQAAAASVDRSSGKAPRSLGEAELIAADQLSRAVSTSEWLGPLAPVALSPFFGITLLSALAIWGPDWMPTNAFLQSSAVLNNGWIFGTFLALTVMTSLPRLTKISKPVAVALDRIETYGTIIILLVIRFLATSDVPPSDVASAVELQIPVVHAGVLTMTADLLLSIAMIINILVVNSVKFFFEFLIWLTPIPLIDALFETLNKTFCAALMGLYAFSPTLATILNLVILIVCAIALRWINRRVRFYRTMIFDPFHSIFFKRQTERMTGQLRVFPATKFKIFPTRACLLLKKDESGWRWTQQRFLLKPLCYEQPSDACALVVKPGWFTNTLDLLEGGQLIASMSFSKRYGEDLQEIADRLGARLVAEKPSEQLGAGRYRSEFA